MAGTKVLRGNPRGDEAHARQRRGTRQLLIARTCFLATSYAVAIVLARTLGPEEYGVYGVLVSLVFWLEMLASTGVPGAASKLIADPRGDVRVEQSARFLLLAVSLVIFVVCWLVAPLVAHVFHIPSGATLFRVAILDLPVAAIYVAYQGILNGHRRFGLLAAGQVIYGGAKLGGVLALLTLGISVSRVLVVNVLATVAVCTFLAIRFPLRGIRPRRDVVVRLASLAVPMGAYVVASQVLLNLDLWSLKSLWRDGGDVIGHYVAALNIAKTLTVIPVVQSGVLFASVAWALGSDNEPSARSHIQEAVRFALVIAAPACILLGLDASAVLTALFSEDYAPGGRVLALQLLGFGLFGLLDAFAHGLMAAGRQWLAAGTLFGVVPLVLLANLVLIRRIGPVGAATSLVIGMVVGTVLTGVLAYRRFGPLIRVSTLGRVIAATAIVGALGLAVPATGMWVLLKLAILGSLYLLLLARFGEVTRADFTMPGLATRDDRAV